MGDLSIQDLVVEYSSGGYAVRPINGLNLEVAAGSLVILLGPSGCGKTTLLSCLGGILRPKSGAIKFDGVDVTALERPRAGAVSARHGRHRLPGVQPGAEPHRPRERDGSAARSRDVTRGLASSVPRNC